MSIPWGYLKRVVAGAVFGHYMAHLLYMLNPQIDIGSGRLAFVTILYGVICGLLFGSILWGLRVLRIRLLGRPAAAEQRRQGFGLIVAAAFISAAVFWYHLVIFRIYLPVGAVRILSIATNLIAGTAFALLLLWLFERNVTVRTSRAIFVIGFGLITVSSFFLYQRRDRYREDVRTAVVANVGTVAGERPVILVAIRNLPYDWLLTLIGEGSLPNLERLSRSGYLARVEPFPTTNSKALWASLATGQLPHRHGVTGRFSYRTPLNPGERYLILPSGVGFAAWGLIPPVQRISAQLPSGESLPLWTMFERLGFSTLVVNWPLQASTDARSESVHVGARVIKQSARREVVPQTAVDTVEGARVKAENIGRDVAQRFAGASPRAQRAILGALAEDLSAMRAALELRRGRTFPLSTIELDGLASVESAMQIDDNRLPGSSTPAGAALRAYAEQIDRFVGELDQQAPNAILAIVSPSAPQPPTLPGNPLAALKYFMESMDPGADDGFVLLRGEGIAHSGPSDSARVTDIVPTSLFAAGLPVARDMDGRVLTGAFSDTFLRENSLALIQTYQAQTLVVRREPAP